MKTKVQKGVWAASLTPMKQDLSIDTELLLHHCNWLLANGADGIVLSGTTGEANSFSVAEKMIMLDDLIAGGISPEKLIVGAGCCAFPDTVSLSQHAVKHGVAGVLLLPPFYYKNVSDEGVFASYEEVIQRVGDEALQIYLYHFPRMSTVPLSLPLISMLLEKYPNQVVGVKDSSGNWENMKAMVENFPGFHVFAGTEAFLLDILRIGGMGCISASVNVTSVMAGEVFAEWQAGSVRADALQEQLTLVRRTLQEHVFIPALKAVLERHTGKAGWHNLRPPLTYPSQSEIEHLEGRLEQVGFNFSHIDQY